ncbi:MAG: hypothetical protein C4527_07270 [Candidatus Omnitrophota bacterium]|jgi:hypothetical protein|nr:MAG: hypothetical protein C4527_07270 [Candidatus Omnitrophota bacterium]
MNPLKALMGTISSLPNLRIHILLTHEDGIVVARCLDFSISSHGEDEEDALASLNDSLSNYLDYAIRQGSLDCIIDPDEEQFWTVYRELEMNEKKENLLENADKLKVDHRFEFMYA